MPFRVPFGHLEKCPFVIGVSADVELDFVNFVVKRGSKHREIMGVENVERPKSKWRGAD